MSSILFYSNHCVQCNTLLGTIAKHDTKDVHFVCIDNRRKNPDGSTKAILQNNKEFLIPPNITSVPSLLLLTRGNRILVGVNEITSHLQPIIELNHKFNQPSATNQHVAPITEPSAFGSWDTAGCTGVVSDLYSYLDQTSDSMLAKGDGGLRQMYSYATIDTDDNIETPVETYRPDTIGEDVSVDKLVQQRATL
jgi:hypothetical protein